MSSPVNNNSTPSNQNRNRKSKKKQVNTNPNNNNRNKRGSRVQPHAQQQQQQHHHNQRHHDYYEDEDDYLAVEMEVEDYYGGSRKGRKGRSVNANHLLNFTSHSPQHSGNSSSSSSRRQTYASHSTSKRFNKDAFVQANCRFLVTPHRDYSLHLVSPDQLVDWDSIDQVTLPTAENYVCPICLDDPLAAKITRCGHVFCFACVLRYLSLAEDDNNSNSNSNKIQTRKCPICPEYISLSDLKTARLNHTQRLTSSKGSDENNTATFLLLKRSKRAVFPVPFHKQIPSNSTKPPLFGDDSCFHKITTSLPGDDWWLKNEEQEIGVAMAVAEEEDNIEALAFLLQAQEFNENFRKQRFRMRNNKAKPDNKQTEPEQEQTEQQGEPETEGNEQNEQQEEEDNLEPLQPWLVQNHQPEVPAQTAEESQRKHDSSPSVNLDKQREEQEDEQVDPALLSTAQQESHVDDDMICFYQSHDGQLVFLHPLNFRCLKHQYQDASRFPESISGKILELESLTVTEELRRRHKFLSHLPLSSSVVFCEVDLSALLSKETKSAFANEMKGRNDKRRRRRRNEDRASKRHVEEEKARIEGLIIEEMGGMSFDEVPDNDTSAFPQLNTTPTSNTATPPPASPVWPYGIGVNSHATFPSLFALPNIFEEATVTLDPDGGRTATFRDVSGGANTDSGSPPGVDQASVDVDAVDAANAASGAGAGADVGSDVLSFRDASLGGGNVGGGKQKNKKGSQKNSKKDGVGKQQKKKKKKEQVVLFANSGFTRRD